MAQPTVVHVISHTHWDREWHLDFQGFRRRLVALIDHLLDLLAEDPEYRYYHLDGQTCPLADYVAIRPERADELRAHIASGRVLVGPFFILPDEFLVSGEATVRNLLVGHRQSREWGGEPMKVGYIPDTFGHISQMPQILRGFGIDNAVLFRGVTYDQVRSEFTWEGPDGSRVLGIKMPDEFAYSNLYYECEPIINAPGDEVDAARALECMARLRHKAEEHATTRHLLAMDGVDHIFPSVKTIGIIAAANEGLPDAEVIHSTLPDYIGSVKAEVGELGVWRGEMRVANRAFRLQALLAGTLSSWMPLKQQNWECQTELERWAEPMTALAGALGAPLEPERGFLRESWRQLLLNHPHDSICGCSTDEVHTDMHYRFRQSLSISQRSAQRSMAEIAERIDTAWVPEGAESVVILNPLGWRRDDLIEADIDFPAEANVQWFRLRDADGNEVPLQRISTEQRGLLDQEPHNIPRGHSVTRHRIAFRTKVPGLGYKVLAAVPEAGPIRAQLGLRTSPSEPDIGVGGVFRLHLEDGGDVGDGYNYVPPQRDRLVLARCENLSVEADGPLFRRLRWDCRMNVPRSATPDLKARSDDAAVLGITVWETIPHGLPGKFYRLRVDNRARDHRLRLVVGYYAFDNPPAAFAESQFDVVERPAKLPDTSDWREEQPPTWPQQSFCGVRDQDPDYTYVIAPRGLPEYEVQSLDEVLYQARVAITLLRCVGRGVGQPEQFVASQLEGEHEFHLAEFTLAGADARTPWREAHNFNVPLRVCQTSRHEGELPPEASLIAIEPEPLCVTALKPAEDRDTLLLRVVNYGPPTGMTLDTLLPWRPRYLCNLAEERIGETNGEGIPIGGRQIVTVEFSE